MADIDGFLRSELYRRQPGLSGHWEHFRHRPELGIARPDSEIGFGKALLSEWLHRFRGVRRALSGYETRRFERLFPEGHYKVADADKRNGSVVPASAFALYHANNILAHIKPKTVLEIGAGYGYLAHYMNAVGAQVTIIDLPEVIPLAVKNLERLNPSASIVLPHEEGAGDYRFLVPSQAPNDVDLAINVASMQEMLPEEIARYFELIHNVAQWFYCSNRVEKWLSTEAGSSDEPKSKRDIPIRFSEFPWFGEDVFYRVARFHRLLCTEPVFERFVRIR